MRNIRLTEEEKHEVESLQKASPNFVIRERCLMLLLSNKGNSIAQVAKILSVHRHTVERLLNKWNAEVDNKLSILYSTKGQGPKVKLLPVADILPDLVEQHNRNLKPILEILEKEYSIKVCKLTLQVFLKGTGL